MYLLVEKSPVSLIEKDYNCFYILFSGMENCVTYKAVILIKTIIAFTFIAMFCTLVAFILDLLGPSQRALKILRRNAILNIVSGLYIFILYLYKLYCVWYKLKPFSLCPVSKNFTLNV